MPDNKILKSALWYAKHGYSVIPCSKEKKALVKWEQYQKEQPTLKQIENWWGKWPKANIALVTGKISNLTVLDADTQEAKDLIESYLPETFLTPIVKSPKGWHYYFKHVAEIPNKANLSKGLDARSEGGYIIAPPSQNGNGKQYQYLVGINNTAIQSMPLSLYSYINSILKDYIYNNKLESSVQAPVLRGNMFSDGRRDEDLFHVANCLTKGGMPEQEIERFLSLIASKVCSPPFPERELLTKIQSAMKRQDSIERNLTEEVREWAMSTSGVFLSTDVHKDLCLSTRVHKKAVSTILARLCDQGIIEKYGEKRGQFRTINKIVVEQEWWKGDIGCPLPVKFPLEIHDFVRIYPGNIILLEGQKSQGKSAFALEFCRMNKNLFSQKILYQNVEMADSELLERFNAYDDVMPLDEWKQIMTVIRQTKDWWDVILSDGLNVIDYLVEYREPWKLPQFVFDIHQRLKSGIALIVVQRDPMKPYPTGGRGVRDIPRAIISLIKHKVRLEDVKSFYQTAYGNPTGLCRKYKQVNWWQFKPDSEWDHEEEEKYDYFKKKEKS